VFHKFFLSSTEPFQLQKTLMEPCGICTPHKGEITEILCSVGETTSTFSEQEWSGVIHRNHKFSEY